MTTTAIDAVRQAIEARLAASWDAVTTPILWANQNTAALGATPPDEFIVPEVFVASIDQASLGGVGSRNFRHSGFFYIHAFTPSGQGEGRVNTLLDLLGELFIGQSFSGVVCYRMALGAGAAGDDKGRHWRKSARFDFYYDKTL